jgi:hypothetical protein
MSNMLKSFLAAAGHAWFLQRKKGLRQRIQQYYGNSQDREIRDILAFVENHPELELPLGMTPPGEWVKEYHSEKVLVEKDERTGLLYVMVNNYRVFFPRKTTPADLQQAVSIGQMEQDPRSPHRYVGDGFNVDSGDVGVFIGASDGLFCLSLIDRLSKAYLFEPNPDWHEPLRATFAPWGDKAEIVPLAVGSRNCDGQISLDHFFKDRASPNYIQVDVDGLEEDVLDGARNLIRNSSKLRLSLCTYHKRLDFRKFANWLGGMGYVIGHSPSFFFLGVRRLCFRRGVLYASRGVNQNAPS